MNFGVLEPGIEFFQLDRGILCCESPPHTRLRSIAMALPSFDFVPQRRHFVDPAVEALPRKNTQFGLSHVQPTRFESSIPSCRCGALRLDGDGHVVPTGEYHPDPLA
jgi:hypothetical protein